MKFKGSISIVIPVYNQSQFLEKSLQSAFSQTRTADEIIVIDDTSKDDTQSILAKFKKKIPTKDRKKLKYYQNKKHLGPTLTWNRCLKLASCDYLILLPADDWLDSTILENEALILDKNPHIAVAYSQCFNIINGDKSIILPKPLGQKTVIGRDEFERLMTKGNFIALLSAMIRLSCCKQLGYFDTNLRFRADYEFWLRLAKSYKFAYIAKPLAYYRIHQTNDHLNPQMQKSFEKEFKYILSKYFNQKNESLASLKIKNDAFYQYYLSIALNEIFAKNIKKAGIFWMKAMKLKPLSILTWKALQPGYFLVREFLKESLVL